MAAIEKRHELKGRRRDPRVQRHLLSYVKSDAGAGAADGDAKDDADVQSTAALAQVGQRILTAMRKVCIPRMPNISPRVARKRDVTSAGRRPEHPPASVTNRVACPWNDDAPARHP